ncbi:MAG: HAMP domain-containing sensor histidine kinase [Azospirillaceae bacterium]|nr:HAMP domain-containing sensor histidine kinase [Azospirillaceae bacterium]
MINRLFGTMLGQILAIIAGASVLTFLLFVVLLTTLYPTIPPPPPWPWPNAYRIAALIDNLSVVPPTDRASMIAAASQPDLTVRLTQAPLPCAALVADARDLQEALAGVVRDPTTNLTVHSCDGGQASSIDNIQVLVAFGDQTLEIRTGRRAIHWFPLGSPTFVGILLFLCIAVVAMSAWAVWRVIGPLRRLSDKADSFGRDIAVAALDEEGPLEIRRAARAFNLMQERIARSVRDRTRMLAAISHDLRTPLTRMRLQLQTGDAGPLQGRLLRDIDLMQSMVTSALDFLSGRFEQEDEEWLDLGVLLTTLCDEFEEAGAVVRYDGPERIRLFCRPNAITRALTNLIENGCQFGTEVAVHAAVADGRVVIDVADNGPGIPADRIEDVLEPFVRLDPARSNRPGSVGLGLSIVKEAVAAHGGTLTLLARQPKGLVARLTLPLPPSGR